MANAFNNDEKKYFLNTYQRLDINIVRGEGCYLITSDGRKILDMFAGLAVNLLGYNNVGINSAIISQLSDYIHISNYFYQEPQIKFAEKLLTKTGFSKLFLSNSGTEATEASIKIIRKYFYNTKRKEFVSFSGGFHGRTLGALSLTYKENYRRYFEPLLTSVNRLSFNNIKNLDSLNENTTAIYLECIQGEGGIHTAEINFINKLKELRDKYGFLIVSDEIQSGLGRTGKFFSFEHFDLKPDIVLMAKGIGGGLPLGCTLVNEKLKDVFEPGDHGSTFGGNPLACAAGLKVLDFINEKSLQEIKDKSSYLINNIESIKDNNNKIKEIRGLGLMIGIELNHPCKDIVKGMLKNNVLVNCTNENVIRLLPPLIISNKEIDQFTESFRKVIS